MTKDIMVVKTEHIVAIDPHHPSGETMVHLSNGEVFHSTMKFTKFREILEGLELKKNMLVSGEN